MKDRLRKLINTLSGDKTFEVLVEMCTMMDPTMGETVKDSRDIFDEMVLDVYMKVYDQEELEFLIERAESDLGRRIAAKEQLLIDESMKIGEKFLAKVATQSTIAKSMGRNVNEDDELVN